MSRKLHRRKCQCCRDFFVPDYRNRNRQKFCCAPACQKASKAKSQRRWLSKDGNGDYFRGSKQVERVQRWRRRNPGYWKAGKPASKRPQPFDIQTDNPEQTSCNAPPREASTLQEVCLSEDPAFVGLISMVTGRTLQEDIAATARQLLIRGQNILGLEIPGEREPTTMSSAYDSQRTDPTGSIAPDSR